MPKRSSQARKFRSSSREGFDKRLQRRRNAAAEPPAFTRPRRQTVANAHRDWCRAGVKPPRPPTVDGSVPANPKKGRPCGRPCKSSGWLRGQDSNLRPLGYEPAQILARLFRSMVYGDPVVWFLPLFGRFCGRSVVENDTRFYNRSHLRLLKWKGRTGPHPNQQRNPRGGSNATA